LEYILTEKLDDGGISGRTGQNRFSCEQVRIDDRVSTGFKERGNGRFSGCYTTCEANDCSASGLEFLLHVGILLDEDVMDVPSIVQDRSSQMGNGCEREDETHLKCV